MSSQKSPYSDNPRRLRDAAAADASAAAASDDSTTGKGSYKKESKPREVLKKTPWELERSKVQNINETLIRAASNEDRDRAVKTTVPAALPMKAEAKVKDAPEQVVNTIAKTEKHSRPDNWKKIGFHELLGEEDIANSEEFPIIGSTEDIHDIIDNQH